LSDLDKIIIEKSNIIKNDFQNQLNYTNKQKNKLLLDSTYEKYNNNKNIFNYSTNNILNDMMNIKYNRSQKDFHKKNKNLKYNNNSCMKIDLDSSKNITYNMTPCSSNQHMNFFSQEDLRNNILNLLDFYSLLKKKSDIVKENNEQNNQKLVIKKEKFNHQLKKNNRLTQKIISVESKIILHATINCTLNEQIILPLIKIKKMESNIYQNIFGLSCYDYDIIKHKEKEKNKLFEEQNIIHLLLIIIKNMIEHYGNISSHVFQDNLKKNKMLKLLLLKYEIEEKKESSINMNLNINKINSKYSNFNNSQFLPGQIVDDDFLNKFKIIREVEEDKEYDDSEEENINQKNKENKNEEIIESIIVDVDENNINDTKNEKEFENGATKNEPEKVITHEDNQYINNNCENKIDLINKILYEEFPKKYPKEDKFIYKSNSEYIFGDNIVNINVNDNSNLELMINGEKYNLDEFIKLFSNNKTIINSNGIETGVDSDKKSEKDKNKSLSHKDNEEDIVGEEINTS
jgi:CCR4-NOT transcription complex subunit 1